MLFKDTNKLLQYAKITTGINFPDVKNDIQLVEEEYLLPLIGRSQYDALNNAYTAVNNEESLSDNQKKLLDKCRAVIGPYFTYIYGSSSDVQLTQNGIQRVETTSHKTAYQYQVKQFLDSMLSIAGLQSEALLRFLDNNKENYTEWATSHEFKKYRQLFIKSGRELNEYFNTATPYRNYHAMRAKMLDVEINSIHAFLGDELFASLKQKDATAQDFTDKEKELLLRLKYSIAAYTVAFAVPFMNVRIDAAGLSMISQTPRSTSDAISSRSNADADSINHFIKAAEDSGRQWLESAKNYLKKNAADFPTFPGNQTTTLSTGKTNNVYGLI